MGITTLGTSDQDWTLLNTLGRFTGATWWDLLGNQEGIADVKWV